MSFIDRTRWSDVYLSAFVQLCGALGAAGVMMTLVIGLEARGASGMQVAALIIAESVPIVALGKVMGRLADRFDSRMLLILAGVGQVASCQILVWASVADNGYPWLIVGGVALATASAVSGPTRMALVPAMVTRDDLPRAIAVGQTGGSLGLTLGPVLAGLLVGVTDVRLTLQITSFLFASTIVAGALLKTRRGLSKADSRTMSTWRFGQDRPFRALVWGMALAIGAVSAVNVVAVFYIIGTLNSTTLTFGVVEAMWTGGVMLGAWLAARRIRPHTGDSGLIRWMLLSLGLLASMILLSGTVPNAYLMMPFYLIGGLLNGTENTVMGTLLGRRAPAESRGRAAAAMQSRVMGGALAGFVAGGVLLEFVTPRSVFIGAGMLGILTVLLVTPLVIRADKLTDYEPAQPSPGGAHPVSQLPSALLGPDALGGADRRRVTEGHP